MVLSPIYQGTDLFAQKGRLRPGCFLTHVSYCCRARVLQNNEVGGLSRPRYPRRTGYRRRGVRLSAWMGMGRTDSFCTGWTMFFKFVWFLLSAGAGGAAKNKVGCKPILRVGKGLGVSFLRILPPTQKRNRRKCFFFWFPFNHTNGGCSQTKTSHPILGFARRIQWVQELGPMTVSWAWV